MMKKIIAAVVLSCCIVSNASSQILFSGEYDDRLSVGVSAGSMGLGFELAMPVLDFLDVRGGFDFMPHFEKSLAFTMTAGNDYNDSESQNDKFDRMSEKLNSLIGIEFDRRIDMIATPSFYNFNIVADVHPFENRKWRISAGLYWSFSKTIGHAENATYDAPALVSASIYNDLYDRVINSYENWEPLIEMPGGLVLDASEDMYNSVMSIGKAGMFIGDSINGGGAYIMYPDENCMVSADMKTNKLKPYLGFGYEGPLFHSTDRYSIAFDCGVLFWGGTPSVITHEGVDIAHDMKNLNGQLTTYVDISNKLAVYPMIKLTISRKLF